MHRTCINKHLKVIKYYIVFFLLINATTTQSQTSDIITKYLLAESEIVGYKLKNQFRNDWIVGDNYQLQKSWRQTWLSDKKTTNSEITVEVCVFNSIVDALNGTAYNSRNYSEQFLWGSLINGIIGDDLWISANEFGNVMMFVRGNVGVHIGAPIVNKQEHFVLEEFAVKMAAKIEANLSQEILDEEKLAKQNQISIAEYNKAINKIYESNIMENLSLFRTKDSKWIIDDNTFGTGLMNEWNNNQGTIIGIDICQFESNELAKQAVNIRSKNTFSPVFDLNNYSTIEEVLIEWEKEIIRFSSKKHNLSAITYQGSTVLLIYQYSPDKVDKKLFSLITKGLNLK